MIGSTEREERLEVLAQTANNSFWAYQQGEKSLLPHALRAGQALIEAQEVYGAHGEWEDWLERNFAGGVRKGQKWMRLARNRQQVEKLMRDKPAMGTDEALDRIKVPRGPHEPSKPPLAGERAKPVVLRTPKAEAVKKVIARWQDELSRWTDTEVIYFADHDQGLLEMLLSQAKAATQPLASILVPAELRRRQAVAELPGGPNSEEQQAALQGVWATYRVELIDGVQGVRGLNEDQRGVLARELGIDDNDGMPPPNQIERRLEGLIAPQRRDHDALRRVALLLNPAPPDPAESPEAEEVTPPDPADAPAAPVPAAPAA
jgi:hypothetical protein